MDQITIDLAPSGAFMLVIPCPAPHHLEIPATLGGLKILHNILMARKSEIRDETWISRRGNPIQAQVNEWLKEDARRLAELRKQPKITEDTGIWAGVDLGGLDL